jgi:hypothetical protein
VISIAVYEHILHVDILIHYSTSNFIPFLCNFRLIPFKNIILILKICLNKMRQSDMKLV